MLIALPRSIWRTASGEKSERKERDERDEVEKAEKVSTGDIHYLALADNYNGREKDGSTERKGGEPLVRVG